MRRFTVVTVALSCAVSFLVGVILAGGLTPAPTLSSAPRTAASRGGSPAVAAWGGAGDFGGGGGRGKFRGRGRADQSSRCEHRRRLARWSSDPPPPHR